jgi:hypothetical protein
MSDSHNIVKANKIKAATNKPDTNFLFNKDEASLSLNIWLSILLCIVAYAFILHNKYAPFNVQFVVCAVFIPSCFIFLRNYWRSVDVGSSVTRGGSRLSDVMAYLFVSEICVAYLAVTGTMGFWRLYSGFEYGNIFEDKIFGKSQFVEEYFSSPMLAYQCWTLIFALVYKEFRTTDFLIHHVMTIGVTVSSFIRKLLFQYKRSFLLPSIVY